MNIPSKIKRVTLMAAISTIGLAFAATPAAFAHSMPNGSQYAHTASSQGSWQDKNSKKDPGWYWWHKGSWNKPSCDQVQASMNQKASAAVTADKKQLAGLDIVLSGVHTYMQSGNITVKDYDTLNASATSDQTIATTDINAITAPQLDCNNTSGQDQSNAQNQLNGSIQKAQKDLYNYRHDLMNLFQAVVNS